MICSRAHSSVTSALPDSKTTASERLPEGAGGVEEARTFGSGCPGLDAFPGPPLIPRLPGSCAKAAPPGPASTFPAPSPRARAQSCFRGTLAATRPLSTARRERPPFQHPAHTRTPPLTHSRRHKHAHAHTHMPTHAYTYLFTHHPHSHVQMPTQTHTAYPCSHALTHACTHTHLPHVCAHTYRHKVHTYLHVLTAGRQAHTCSHTFDHRGRKAETHRQKPRSEAHHLLPREQRSSGNGRPWRPRCPPLAAAPRCLGLPLSRSQAPVPPVGCTFSSLPSPLQSSCSPQHPLPGDHRTQTPTSKQGLFPNDLMRFPLWRLSQSHWQDPPPLGGDMGTEAFHCPSNQRVCVSSSINSQGEAQRRMP